MGPPNQNGFLLASPKWVRNNPLACRAAYRKALPDETYVKADSWIFEYTQISTSCTTASTSLDLSPPGLVLLITKCL